MEGLLSKLLSLVRGVLQVFGEGMRRQFPNLTRWLTTMMWHPHAVAAIGVAVQPPEKPVLYQEGASNAWGEGPNPMAQIMPKGGW